MQISFFITNKCPLWPKSQLLYLTLAMMQGFGRVGGCLGLGLEERGGRFKTFLKNLVVPKGRDSPFGVWDGACRSGCSRSRCGRWSLGDAVALRRGRASNHTGGPGIGREGFLRRTGLLQLLMRESRHCNCNSPAGGTHGQLMAARAWSGPVLLSQALGRELRRSCQVVLIFRGLRSWLRPT